MKGLLLKAPLLLAFTAGNAAAQHSIEVQRLTAKGEYFEALTTYEKLPKRKTTSGASIAAAKSAWGLGLPLRAIEEFDKVLRDESLDSVERARILLSRGIIEYQEDRTQVAALYAEKSAALLPEAGPLRAKAWFLWGQALDRMGQYGPAEDKYVKAIEEGEIDDKGDMHFMLGRCLQKLGKNAAARENLEKVPLRHDKTAKAVRALAELSLAEHEYDQAEFWLGKGRQDYADEFLDSWVDYALMQVAISRSDQERARLILEESKKKYPPSDHWLNLLSAAEESFMWQMGRADTAVKN